MSKNSWLLPAVVIGAIGAIFLFGRKASDSAANSIPSVPSGPSNPSDPDQDGPTRDGGMSPPRHAPGDNQYLYPPVPVPQPGQSYQYNVYPNMGPFYDMTTLTAEAHRLNVANNSGKVDPTKYNDWFDRVYVPTMKRIQG